MSTSPPKAPEAEKKDENKSGVKAYPMPQEAEIVQADLRKKKKELAGIKTSSLEALETKE